MSRRAQAAIALAFVAAYVASAALSARLSPLARAPLFDGAGALQPYRWVSPPPSLAATNVQPSAASTTVAMGPNGTAALNLVTADKQVIMVLRPGAVAPRAGVNAVRADIVPLDPGKLAPLAGGLSAFGNAYRISLAYLPSKAPVTALRYPLDVVLEYPVTASLYALHHQIQSSPTGKAWTRRKSTDLLSTQQVEALVPYTGYVVVAGKPGPAPVTTSPATGTSGGSGAIVIVLLVAAGIAVVVGIALIVRNGRVSRTP